MILSAHQPAYLPWLGYFHKMALSDVFVILDRVQFEKNSFVNRNKIKTPQGSIWLTIPVLISGHTEKTIRDMEINNSVKWREKHWKSIYLNYKKTPFFCQYSDFFEDLYKREWVKLHKLLDYMTDFLVKELKINTTLYRQNTLQITSKKQRLILDLCKHFDSKLYISGILGKDYIDVPLFEKNRITVVFQSYDHPVYPQHGDDFLSHLSILDLLFNVGAEKSLEITMGKNITKKDLKEILK